MSLDTNLSVINSDLIFQSKLETMSNLEKLLPSNPVGNISAYSISPIDSFKERNNITVLEGLSHPDYNIRMEANKLHEQDLMQKDKTYGRGLGEVFSTPWEQAEKYSGKKYGFDFRVDNEQKYYEDYLRDFEDGIPFNGSIRNVGRFLGRTILPAATKFLEGVGYIGAMINPMNWDNNYWENIADNTLSNIMLDWEKVAKNSEWLDVYHGIDYSNKGFFEKVADPTFWTDEFADGVAFLASAFIPASIASKAGWLGKAGQTTSLFGTGSKLAKGANVVTRTLTGSDTWGEVGLWAFNTANESAFEAAHAFKENFKDFKERRDNNEAGFAGKSDDELRRLAGEKSSNIFKGNLAVLGLSTAWEQRMIFKPLLGRIAPPTASKKGFDIIDNISAKALGKSAPTTNLGKILDWSQFYGKRAIGGLMTEGYWEENAQLAIERINSADRSHDYTNLNDNSALRFFDQLTTQAYKAALGEDKEAATSIGLGGLISMFGLTARNLKTGKTDRTSRFDIDPITKFQVNQINQLRNHFLSVPQLMNEQGQLDPTKVKIARDEISKILQQSISAEVVASDKLRGFLQDNNFAKYVTAILNAGKFENMVSRLQELSTKTPEQLAQLGLDATNIRKTSAELIVLANEIKKVKEDIDRLDISTQGSTEQSIAKRKELATNYTNQSIAARNLKNAAVEKSSQTSDALSKLSSPTPTEIKEINILNRMIKELEIFISDEQVPNFIKEQKKKEIKELKEKLKNLEEVYSKFEKKDYEKDKDGYYFGKNKDENDVLVEFIKSESSNRINNQIEADKLFVAQELLSKERGEKALSDINEITKKLEEKTKKEAEKTNNVKTSVKGKVGNVIIEEEDTPTTDEEFIKKINNSLKDTYLTVGFDGNNYKLNNNKNTPIVTSKYDNRQSLIEALVKELQKDSVYKIKSENIEEYPEDKQQDLEGAELNQFIADELARLEIEGEGMKKETEILPFTDSSPVFEERFNNPELEPLHRRDYLFHNFVRKIGRFANKLVRMKAIPITNLNVNEVTKLLGLSDNSLDFLLPTEDKYKFVDGQDNKSAVVTYIYVEEKDGQYFLLDKQGERTTDLNTIVVAKHVNRSVEELKAKGETNPIRNGSDEKRIQSVMDAITSFYNKLSSFVAFDFEISKGIRNVPMDKIETKEGFPISVPRYVPKLAIDNAIKKEDIGKTAFVHVQTKTVRTTTGENLIAGRPYLKTIEDNNTGTPIERFQYLDNRKLTEEEKEALKKALNEIVEEFKNTKALNKQTDAYRYLQGLILRKGNLMLSVSKSGNLMLSPNEKGNPSFLLNDEEVFFNYFNEHLDKAYHRVDSTLVKEEKNTEFLDYVSGKTYPTYHHYLLENVLTIRLEDRTQNKPDGEPTFDRIQRYSIIDMTSLEEIQKAGVKKEEIINRVSKDEKKPKTQRQIKARPDIVLKVSDKKNTSPTEEKSKKTTSNSDLEKAIAKDKAANNKTSEVEEKGDGLDDMRRAIQQDLQAKNREILEKEESTKPSPKSNLPQAVIDAINKDAKAAGRISKKKNQNEEEEIKKPPVKKETEVKTPEVKPATSITSNIINKPEVEGESKVNIGTKAQEKANELFDLFDEDDDGDFLKVEDKNWSPNQEVSQWEIDEVNRILNQVELVFSNRERIFNGKTVWGSTKWVENKKAIITLYNAARSGTGFHEAFEVVYNFILSYEQQEYLINKFKKREGEFTTFEGVVKPYSQATAKEAKEKMADEYADYKFGRPIPEEAPSGFFQKLWNFINNFIRRVIYRNKFFENSLYNERAIFEMMDNGSFRGIELKKDTQEYFSIAAGNSIINSIDTEQFMRSANYLMFTILNKQNTNLLTTLEEGGGLNLSIYNELRQEIKNYYDNKEELRRVIRIRVKQVAEILQVDEKTAKAKVMEDLAKTFQFVEDITSTEEGWNQFVQNHKNYLSKFGIAFEEDVNEEKEGTKTNEYNNDKLKFDNFRSTPAAIKLLISSLEERVYDGTSDGQQVINPVTLSPHTISEHQYITIFNRIMNFLSGSSSIEQVKEKIDSFLRKERNFNSSENRIDFGFYSIVKQLREKILLNQDGSELDWKTMDKFQVKNLLRFVGAFAKQKPTFFRAKFDENNKVYFTDADFESQIAYTRKNFYNYHRNKVFTSKPPKDAIFVRNNRKISINKNNIPVIPSIGSNYSSNLEDFSKSLNQLGFPFFTKERLEVMLLDERKLIYEEAQMIASILNDMKSADSISAKGLGFNGRVNTIARVIAYYSSDDSVPMLFNAEGEAQSKYIDHNTMSLLFSDMEYITSIANTPEDRKRLFLEKNPQYSNSYFENSIILNNFYRNGIVPKTSIFSGLDEYEQTQGRGASSLTHEELYITRFVLGFAQKGRNAIYPIYENADGNIDWQIDTGISQYVEFSDLSRGKKIENTLIGYLTDDINAILDYKKSPIKGRKDNHTKKISTISANGITMPQREAGLTLGFSGIYLDDVTLNNIYNIIDNNEDINVKEIINQLNIKQQFNSYIEQRVQEHLNFLEVKKFYNKKEDKIPLLPDDLFEDIEGENKIPRLIKLKVANDFFAAVENSKLIFGRMESFKSINESLKRFKSFLSPRLTTLDSNELNEWMNENMNDVKENDLTYHLHKSTTSIRSIKDIETFNSTLSSIQKNYKNNNAIDAQSVALASSVREIKMKTGAKWTERKENMYQVHIAYERWALDKKGIQPYTNEKLKEKDLKTLELFKKQQPEDYEGDDVYILNLMDLEQFEEENIIKPIISGLDSKGYAHLVKTSTIPLTYYLVEGTHMEDIYLDMRRNKDDIFTYKSAHKIGQEVNEQGLVGEIINNEGVLNNLSEIAEKVEIDKKNTSIQVETEGEKDRLTAGTQSMKIATTDIYSDGVPMDFGKDDNKFNPDRVKMWLALSEEEKLAQSELYRLERDHNTALSELFLHHYYNFLNQIGVIERIENGITSYTSLDNKKLRDKIEEYVTRHGVPKNIIEQLQYNESGETIKYELMSDYTLIKSIIYSMIDKGIASPKFNGGQKIQFASMFFDKKKDIPNYELIWIKEGKTLTNEQFVKLSEEEKQDYNYRLTNTTLKFYEKGENNNSTKRMQVMISSRYLRETNKKRQSLKLPLLSEQEFLELLRNESPKILEGVGFRIPTQALNSMEAFDIVGFLPDFMGDAVAVPSELTTKAGSDFDVDKLSTYLNNMYVDNKGIPRYVEFDNNTTEESYINRYVQYVNRYAQRDDKEYIEWLSKGLFSKISLQETKERIQKIAEINKEFKDSKDYFYKKEVDDRIKKMYTALETSDSQEYLTQLFEHGTDLFFSLPENITDGYFDLKNSLYARNIQGPLEIQEYLNYTNLLLETKQGKNHSVVLLQMIEVYTEELRVLGIQNDFIKEQVNSYLENFRKTKSNLFDNKVEDIKEFVNKSLDERKEKINQQKLEISEEIASLSNLPNFEQFKQLPIYRQNSRAALENRYFQAISNILLHPSSFDRFIRPNDASKLEKVAKEMEKLKGRETKESIFDLGKLMNSLYMTSQRALFQAGKRLVGIGAVGVTGHSNMQKIISVVTKEVEKEPVKDSKTDVVKVVTLQNKLIYPHNKIGNLATLSGTTTKDGDEISGIGGAVVDGTVDIVNKPWLISFAAYGLSYSPAVIANRLGYSKNDIALIINNPLVFEFQRMKDYAKSPAKRLDEEKKFDKTPFTKIEWLSYFGEELGMDIHTYFSTKEAGLSYQEIDNSDRNLIKKAISISHHNIEGDVRKGNFDFDFFKEHLKTLPNDEAIALRFAVMNCFEEFLNLNKIANDVRAITSSSNHETAHIKDNSTTLSKESNMEFVGKMSVKALVGYDSENNPITENAAKAMREKLFIGVIADKIVNFENNYIYQQVLLPQTQQLARWVVKQLSKEEEFEVYQKKAEEIIKDFEKSVMSAFLFDATLDTMSIPVKAGIKEVTDYTNDLRVALDKAIVTANNSKFDSDKFKKGLNVLELLEIVPEDIDDSNNDFYYVRIKKRPTSQDTLGSASLYDGLLNLKYNTEKIEGTNYTYADMYNLLMLHSIYRNGNGFSRNSLLPFMSPQSYRSISEGIIDMTVDEDMLKSQEIVMIQNKPSLLGKKYDYFKGPIIRVPVKNRKAVRDNKGDINLQQYGNAKYKNTSAYKVNTGEKENEVLEFDDLILLPGIVEHKNSDLSSLKGKDKDAKIAEMNKNQQFNNHQIKNKFIYYKAGSKKKGNNVEVLLYRTGATVEINGLTYFVYQHFPIKGSKYSREFGSIRSEKDYQSQMRDENVPIYSQSEIMEILSQIGEEDERKTKAQLLRTDNPSIINSEDALRYTQEFKPEIVVETEEENEIEESKPQAKVIPTNRKSIETKPSVETINIYAGTGENAELSNFANRPVKDPLGVSFKNVEAAFQYAKINYSTEDNSEIAIKLQTASGPEAKTLGKKIKGLNVKAWDENSSKIMKNIIKESFIENPKALSKLLATGNAKLTHTQDKGKWGTEFPRLLMEIRNELSNQSTTEEEIKEPIKEEKKTSTKKGTFTYNDKTIETEFELTNSQDTALRSLIDFSLQDEKRMITLQGPAGTGKTSTIGNLQNYLKDLGYNVVYMAPSHAATAELAFATVKYGNKELPLTVQSAFQRRFDPQTGQDKYGITNKLKARLGLNPAIIVVDESSMLNSKDYEIIKEVVKTQGGQIKVIFMGDPMQIPEVISTNPESKDVSKAFTEQEQVLLTEIKRTNDMSILNILTKLRDYLTSYIPRIPSTDRLKYLKEFEFNKELVNKFKTNPENTVLISYTNKSVQSYNNEIRKVLGREGDLQKGDLIVGFLGYQSKQIEKGNIANSVRYTVDTVTKNNSEYIITANSSKLKGLEKLNMKGVREKATTSYLQLSNQDSLIFEELTKEDFDKNNRKVSDLLKRLYNAKQAALKNRSMWSVYYDIQRSVTIAFENIDLGNDYVYNPQTDVMELYNSITHRQLLKDFPELKVEKGIDFGHAITVHKSQGQTIKNVFFNTSSLPKGDVSKIMMNGKQISSEKQSLIYVGLSRASENLYILDEGANFYDFEKGEITEPQSSELDNNSFNYEEEFIEDDFIPSEEDEKQLDNIRQALMKDVEYKNSIAPDNLPEIDPDGCL